MLRNSLRSARALSSRRIAATASASASASAPRLWRTAGVASQRFYADAPKTPIIPASETTTAASSPPPPPSSSSSIPSQNVPLTPPTPSEAAAAGSTATTRSTQSTQSTQSTPPPPPPRRKGGFFRKLRNYILTLSIIGALAFGGGVWYSRINDNFHDFFTEYIPFGEQAVLYLEELDFQKRFPNIADRISRPKRDTGDDVRVPAQSGASWRVADPEGGSRQSAAVSKSNASSSPAPKPTKSEEKPAGASAVSNTPASAAPGPGPAAADSKPAKAKKALLGEPPETAAAEKAIVANTAALKSSSSSSPSSKSPAPSSSSSPSSSSASSFKPPEVDEPSRWPPASPIDPLTVKDATEPVVQDVVRLLNDIITVVNADRASDRYGATIGKAKEAVNKVGAQVRAIREAAEQKAAKQVEARTTSFDQAAQDLVDRVEKAMAAQEAQWRAEYDAELARVRGSYEERLQLATQRERALQEEKLQNKLLEQAVQMTQQFADELKTRVEQERNGRLGRLENLSKAVADLETLTAGWTDVVDASQRAQQLHVAIDAVRARLADDQPVGPGQVLRPFVKELVAIKEIAAGDPVVDAAIAAIPPAAYQRGIASPAELIDRFRRVASEVRKASLLPEDAGVASHASSYVLSKVLFKKQPASTTLSADNGNPDVETILTRAQALLEEGNLDGAAREVNGLTGWAKTLSRDWLGEVRKVLEVQQALDVITAEARLRSLQLEKSR